MECITKEFATVLIEIVVFSIYKDTLTFDLFPSAIKVELNTINSLPSGSYLSFIFEVGPVTIFILNKGISKWRCHTSLVINFVGHSIES